MAVGGDLNPPEPAAAAAGGSGLNPTTVTPVPAGGKANATRTSTAAGAGASKTPGQSNLEKLLNQLNAGSKPPAEPLAAGATTPESPDWAVNVESSLLTVAAKAQQQAAGAGRLFMNYVAVAGCTPNDGTDLRRMVESKWILSGPRRRFCACRGRR